MSGHLSVGERWRIIALYEETRDVSEREGRGRSRLIVGPVRRCFRQIMSQYPADTSFLIANLLEQRTGVKVSDRTIRDARRHENYRPVHVRVYREINKQQAARRYQYSCTHRLDTWKRVIFSDEKKFEVDQAGIVYWIPIGVPRSRTFVGQVKYSVTVFGAVWHRNRSRLVFIQGSSNSITYLQHVKLAIGHCLRTLRGYSFIHDRTSWSHTNLAHDWMNSHGISYMDDYPSVSPELNAIESVLGWMNRYVQSLHPTSQRHLEDLVRQAWSRIPINVIQAYIRHIHTIVQQIIDAQGWDIDA